MSVLTQPGHMTYTAMPFDCSASASMIVAPLSASFEPVTGRYACKESEAEMRVWIEQRF